MSLARLTHVLALACVFCAILAVAPPTVAAEGEQGSDQAELPDQCEWYEPGDIDAPPECGYDDTGEYPDDTWEDDSADAPQEPAAPDPLPPLGPVAWIGPDGRRAIAPKGAPRIVRRAINAANRLTRKPYKWGGGHARLDDRGYDCSGAISYVLRSIGKLRGAVVSGQLKRWGVARRGKWITVYANKNHVFMVIAGLRFDTSGDGERGPRWRPDPRPVDRFAVRHWPKL